MMGDWKFCRENFFNGERGEGGGGGGGWFFMRNYLDYPTLFRC